MLHHHPIHRFYNIPDGIKGYASCSIAPDSRRSESKGLLLDPRVSTARDNWESAITGTFNSFALNS
jgi:hypothetical protein